MKYKLAHNCIKVGNLQKSLAFYREALHMAEKGRVKIGSTVLAYLGDEAGSGHELELNYHPEHKAAYNLGENPVHLAFQVDDFAQALSKHREMGCIKFLSQANHIYFIEDPDGYLIEILPQDHFSIRERRKTNEDE